MKIAVVGAGLSGLSVAYLLSQTVSIDIEIILWEEKEGGGGASRTGAGMLHPFAGARSRLNWRGFEGFDATLSYLKKYPEVILQKGILRPPQSVVQRVDFLACAEQFPQEAIFTEAGLWLPHGIVVDLPLYLHHLWKSVLESGVVFEQKKINNREELKDFEVAVFAVGGDFSSFSSLLPDDIQLKAVKGQLLELLWPKEWVCLSHSSRR